MTALLRQPFNWTDQTAREPVELLRAALMQALLHPPLTHMEIRECTQQLRPRSAHLLRRTRWRWRAHIGGKINERKIRLMPNTADHRQRARRNRPNQRFLIKCPQIFQRAAATAH